MTIHPNSGEGIFTTSPSPAGAPPTYDVEWHTGLSQVFRANLISLVCHGVFERFPALKVVIAEGGFAWLPDVLWRLALDALPPQIRQRVRADNALQTYGDRL